MSYHIIATIKGKQERLNKVGPPTYLTLEGEHSRKQTLFYYAKKEFRDIVDEIEDITEIHYTKGKQKLISFSMATDMFCIK